MIPGASSYSNIVPHGGNTEQSDDSFTELPTKDWLSGALTINNFIPYWNIPNAIDHTGWVNRYYPITRPVARAGLFPSVFAKRFMFHGTISWQDDGTHTQVWVPLSGQTHIIKSPNVFLAFVWDHGTPTMYSQLTGHDDTIVDFPILAVDDVFDMSLYRLFGVDVPDFSPAGPLPAAPGPIPQPKDPGRYEVLWSQTFIPDQTPAATFTLLERIVAAEPALITEEFSYNYRTMYFSATVDMDHRVDLMFHPAEGSTPPRYNPAKGCGFIVMFQSGGLLTNSAASTQIVDITARAHVLYSLNPQ